MKTTPRCQNCTMVEKMYFDAKANNDDQVKAIRELQIRAEQAETRLAEVVKARDWILRRCNYAPPCGRCRYCESAEQITRALAAAQKKQEKQD